jgi:TPR repeat protein
MSHAPFTNQRSARILGAIATLTACLAVTIDCSAQAPSSSSADDQPLRGRGDAAKTTHFLTSSEMTEALDRLKKSADAQNVAAMLELGSLYEKGFKPELYHSSDAQLPDIPFACRWYARAAALGSNIAQEKLKKLAPHIQQPPETPAQIEALISLAQKGDSTAMAQLGEALLLKNTKANDEMALSWFEKACQQGNTNAMIQLGQMYAMGWGVPKNLNAAEIWFTNANSPAAKRNTALLHLQGNREDFNSFSALFRFFDINFEPSRPAFTWPRSASRAWGEFDDANRQVADLNDAIPYEKFFDPSSLAHRNWMLRLKINASGHSIREGCVIHTIDRSGNARAANTSDPFAMLEMGYLSSAGIYGYRDIQQAISWFTRAAATGNPDAMLSIAILYHTKPLLDATATHGVIASNLDLMNDKCFGFEGSRGNCARPDPSASLPYELQVKDTPWNIPNPDTTDIWLTRVHDRFEQLAKLGDASAANHLGEMHTIGYGVPQSHEKAMVYFQTAASAGNAAAMCNIALAYEYGRAVPKDRTAALVWYEKAGDAGHAMAMYRAGLFHEKTSSSQADSWFQAASEMGNDEATAYVVQKRERQLKALESKAAAHDVASMYQLASFYRDGTDEHIQWLTQAAAAGSIEAMLDLHKLHKDGVHAMFGWLIKPDHDAAAKWLNEALKTQDPRAFTAAGRAEFPMYFPHDENAGASLKAAWDRASVWYLKAAQAGDPTGMFLLAMSLSNKPDERIQWLRKAAEKGYTRAMTCLAETLEEKPQPDQNPDEIVGWYTKAFNAGLTSAADSLSVYYATGSPNRPMDEAKAIFWKQRGYKSDKRDAVISIASSFQHLRKPPTQSHVYWLIKAAELSDPDSIALLAKCFVDGTGCEKNPDKAIQLYIQAARFGHPKALQYLKQKNISWAR